MSPNTRTTSGSTDRRKGRQLAAANLTKRFSRAKADQEVADLIERANQINARDELVFYVHKIHAFGSYLTDIADVGDIDLVVELGGAGPAGNSPTESHYRADNSGKPGLHRQPDIRRQGSPAIAPRTQGAAIIRLNLVAHRTQD